MPATAGSADSPVIPATAREVRLARRPRGVPVPADFAVATVEIPAPEPGELLVRNLAFSVDPYMRGRMNEGPSYAPAWELDRAMLGGAIGEVVAGGSTAIAPGTLVEHSLGWREYAVVPVAQAGVLDPGDQPISLYLGVLGMTGLTAWAGLFDVAEMQPGQTVFVSGAAGAVGSVVGQLAKARGAARVIGSAGGPGKVAHLVEDLHYDAAIDYRLATRPGDLSAALAAAAPDGIDVYFDNVGGEHLEAAIDALRVHGRVAACGAISGYNATEPSPAPRNLSLMVGKRLRLQGFLVGDHVQLRAEFRAAVAAMLADGRMTATESVSRGLDSAVGAFLGLFTGANTGKAVVALAETSSAGQPVTA